jgi:fumarate reductase subunit C
MPTFWWLGKSSYFWFIFREVSSLFVGWFVVYLILLVRAVSQGVEPYRAFLDWSASGPILLLNLVTFVFVLYHAVTWFNLTPQAIALRSGGRRVPDSVIATAHFVAWGVVSVLAAWLILGA